MWAEQDYYYARIALRIAEIAQGKTSPNPLVGAVLVKNNKLISSGYHPRAGEPHAEVFAIKNAKENIANSKLYLTLEPCCFYGKTPPCTDLIIKSKINEVIIATYDPNPQVNKKGIKILQNAGIKVKSGLLEQEAQDLNKEFFTYHKKKRPYIRIKFAMTLDSKIASSDKKSKWISSETMRNFTHRLRALSDGVLVGINTILSDDPSLNIRIKDKENKIFHRIILDSFLKIPPSAQLFKDNNPVLIFTSRFDKSKKAKLPSYCEVMEVSLKDNKLNLEEIMQALYEKKILSILVEGGAETIGNFFEHQLSDEMIAVITPKILGSTALSFSQFIKEKPLASMIKIFNSKMLKIKEDYILFGHSK